MIITCIFVMIATVYIDIWFREELYPYWCIVLFFEDKEIQRFIWRTRRYYKFKNICNNTGFQHAGVYYQ